MKQLTKVYFGILLQWIFIGFLIAVFILDVKFMLIKPAIIILFILIINLNRKINYVLMRQDSMSVDSINRLRKIEKENKDV